MSAAAWRIFVRAESEKCMTKLNALLLVWLSIAGFGCAASTDDPSGLDVEGDTQALDDKGRLLALGDSIAFGYSPFGDFTKDKNFSGYPEALSSSFSVKNSSCPGETSGSFLSTSAPDNGCRSYKAAYPLHVNYGSNVTQMDYALSRVTSTQAQDVPTQITLNVSGNDIFVLQAQCASATDPAACFSAGVPALIGTVAQNVGTILGGLRQAGYTGPITYMNLYSTDYSNPNTVGFLNALNGNVSNVARQFGAKIANAFGAFQTAAGSQSPCAAGLLIPIPSAPGTCDVHPTAAGTAVLAQSVRDAS
jgi:lysophospholipase L1-like esterase